MTVGTPLEEVVNTGTSLAANLEDPGRQFITDPISAGLAGTGQRESAGPGRERRQLEQRLTWVSPASQWGLAEASVVRLGVIWTFDREDRGRDRHVLDAVLYAEADSIGLGQRFCATGRFADDRETSTGGVAELSAIVELDHFYLQRLNGSHVFDIRIRGDGSGQISSRPSA